MEKFPVRYGRTPSANSKEKETGKKKTGFVHRNSTTNWWKRERCALLRGFSTKSRQLICVELRCRDKAKQQDFRRNIRMRSS
ncbi:hypothetical protein Y032_0016g2954 [Ancylostoma ceylanicum]|uniref:Uncharacterized protein n=1 Tax=Ancylostoma ceylanicum TaxID=53326 RepID=A0A016V698_9BILA|nr:hypothetical protein Y032_0016g2954 [Ancylostoma ceylanicum]